MGKIVESWIIVGEYQARIHERVEGGCNLISSIFPSHAFFYPKSLYIT